MTIDHVAWARTVRIQPATLRESTKRASIATAHAVLSNLASHANDEGEAWPNIETIADEVRRDRRTIQRSLRVLEDQGLIRLTGYRQVGGRRRERIWIVNPDKEPEGRQSDTPKPENKTEIEGRQQEHLRGGSLPPKSDRGAAAGTFEGRQQEHLRGGSLPPPYKEERLSGESTVQKTPAPPDSRSSDMSQLLREYPPDHHGDVEAASRVFKSLSPSPALLERILGHVAAKKAAIEAQQGRKNPEFIRGWPDLVKFIRGKYWEWELLPSFAESPGDRDLAQRSAASRRANSSEEPHIPGFGDEERAQAVSIWENVLKRLRERCDDESYGAWIEPIQPIGVNGAGLYLATPSDFFRSMVESCAGDELSAAIGEEVGGDGRFRLCVVDPP